MYSQPDIRTGVPGPKAKALIALDKKYISPSYTRSYPVVVERGTGCWVWDVDGNRFLDMNAGIAVCSTGHRHPRVIEAVKAQLERLIHMSGTDFYYPEQVELAQKLAEIVPGGPNRRAFLTNSGTESNECALKLARYKTGRQNFIAFVNSFHGRTFGSMSVTGSKAVQRQGFGPLLPGVFFAPFPCAYRPPLGATKEQAADAVLDYINTELFGKVCPAEDTAAVIVEPVQGEGGYAVPVDGFLPRLKALCDEQGIILIMDEVQSGMGRTGRMFCCEHQGVIPDVVTIAKGIASGFPLGACVSKSSVMDWPVGAHANTFGGNPVAARAAMATISLLEEELIENAEKVGGFIRGELLKLADEFECIGDVRGMGLLLAVDFVKERETKEHDTALRDRVVTSAAMKGALFLGAGKSAVRIAPPLVITREEANTGIEILAEAIRQTAAVRV